jgi:hypothetical protein
MTDRRTDGLRDRLTTGRAIRTAIASLAIRPSVRLSILIALSASCKPYTTRPTFPPVAGAPFADVTLPVAQATQILADALRADSFPVSKVEPRDGLVETPWFNVATRKPTDARRLGPDVVQVRGWVDPTKPGSSRIVVETVFRPLADPSLPDRLLDHLVPSDHPIGVQVDSVVTDLATEYGEKPDSATTTAPAPTSAPVTSPPAP